MESFDGILLVGKYALSLTPGLEGDLAANPSFKRTCLLQAAELKS